MQPKPERTFPRRAPLAGAIIGALASLLAVPSADALSYACGAPNTLQSFTNVAPAGTSTGTIQSVVVPGSQVTIDAAGAQGGSIGGLGAEVATTVAVTAGQTLCVIVGNQGGLAGNGAGGGGGGSFVYLISSGTCASNLGAVSTGGVPTLLAAAAGGGGGSSDGVAGSGGLAPTGAGNAGASAGSAGFDAGGAGGINGNGGAAVVNSGGGGGLLTGGGSANGVPGGAALIAGAFGGVFVAYANGGFGGGGGGAATGGGGGGYNGGGGGGTAILIGGGGGAGSFSAAAPLAPYTQSSVQAGNGAVNVCLGPAAAPVPGLGGRGFALAALLLGAAGVLTLRRPRRTR